MVYVFMIFSSVHSMTVYDTITNKMYSKEYVIVQFIVKL